MAASQSHDRRWLYAAVLARSLATGMMGVLLGIYLASLDARTRTPSAWSSASGWRAPPSVRCWSPSSRIASAAAARCSILTALSRVRRGHAGSCPRRLLTLGIAAFLGMVNGMGRDRGAALVVEQSVLPATVADGQRTLAFAQVQRAAGHRTRGRIAARRGAGAVPALHGARFDAAALQGSVLIYAALSLLPFVAYLRLSDRVEVPRSETAQPSLPPRAASCSAQRACSPSTPSAAGSSRPRCSPTSSTSASG